MTAVHTIDGRQCRNLHRQVTLFKLLVLIRFVTVAVLISLTAATANL